MTARTERSQTADRLWADYARNHDPRTRDALVQQFERLAYSIANRYARRGTDNEDLFQVARMGLVKAVDRFDPTTHYRFSTFATPTIRGEIQRYFRDHSWNVHVPRGMQDTWRQVEAVSRKMTETLGRTPTAEELAAKTELPVERVNEALSLHETNRLLSLDGEIDGDGSDRPTVLESSLGGEDRGLGQVENRVGLRQAMGHLNQGLREIIELRYLQSLSQREVGRRLSLSQMQVCRMERRALEELRSQLTVH
jgi:RNA polymerase sigma-B factor